MAEKNICCPECGGGLVYEVLGQYGIIRKVNPDGLIQNRQKKVDYGSTNDMLLYCPTCHWRCDNFVSDGISVEVNYEDEE